MENEPTTPVEQSQAPASEINTNSNAPAEPQITAEQVAKFLGTDADTIAKVQKFAGANGGFGKVFDDRKQAISNPAPAPTTSSETVQQAQTTQTVNQPSEQQTRPTEPVRTPEGYLAAQDLTMLAYRDRLIANEHYANIRGIVESGSFLKEMADFGMTPVDANGNINDTVIRKFLDLKAAGVATRQAANVQANASQAPTVDYTDVPDGKITSMDMAYRVFGEKGNPNYQAAADYIKEHFGK